MISPNLCSILFLQHISEAQKAKDVPVSPRVESSEIEVFRWVQGCISCGPCSYPELTEDHVLTSAYVKIFRTVTRNAVNKSV